MQTGKFSLKFLFLYIYIYIHSVSAYVKILMISASHNLKVHIFRLSSPCDSLSLRDRIERGAVIAGFNTMVRGMEGEGGVTSLIPRPSFGMTVILVECASYL